MADPEGSPLVTLAVPCFNEERYVEAFLADVFAQDYPSSALEILIGDGMSTDRTREIIGGVCHRHPGRLRIIDNPHRKRGLGSRPFDGEGLPTRRRAVIDDGVLTTWLLDLASARQLNLTPTGHGPGGGTSNFYLEKGELSPDELIADIKSGLYITDIEVLRLHYAETLKRWRERFMARWDEVARLYDERFCRMWEFYLALCEIVVHDLRHFGHELVESQQLGRLAFLGEQAAHPLDHFRGAPAVRRRAGPVRPARARSHAPPLRHPPRGNPRAGRGDGGVHPRLAPGRHRARGVPRRPRHDDHPELPALPLHLPRTAAAAPRGR